MRFLYDIIKGIFIGVANIIPGVSGGTMAVSMGVYDKMVESINSLFKSFKKSFLTLLPLLIGMVAGICVFSLIIPYCLTNYSFQTCMCFIGLIFGGVPAIIATTKSAYNKESRKSISAAHILAFVIMFGISVAMAFANPEAQGADSFDINAKMMIILFVIGIVAAAAMVIPGISGSLILMMLGYYSGVIGTIKNLLTGLKNTDFSLAGKSVLLLLPFGIGCILGILLISKIITWLLNRFESITYFAILGLVISSPIAILIKMENPVYTAVSIITAILLFAAGFLFSFLFGKKSK